MLIAPFLKCVIAHEKKLLISIIIRIFVSSYLDYSYMIALRIRQDIFKSLINDGCAHITMKADSAEKYTIDEKENGVPFREIVITESVNEETMTKDVTIVSNKLFLREDTKPIETLEDDIVTWSAEESDIFLRDANNLIKQV